MKTLNNTIKVTLLSLIFLSTSVFGGNKHGKKTNQNQEMTIEIDGKVLIPKNDDSKLYKIELLCHNTVVDSGLVVDSESFLLKVKKNSWYTIRITKQGYYPMIVSIDTKLPVDNMDSHKFHFDTELISKNSKVDSESVEFPIAIISFDQNQDSFSPVREYSKNIKSSIFELPVKEGFVSK